MPEGDTIHRTARKLGSALVGKRVVALELSRQGKTLDASRVGGVTSIEARGKNLLIHFEGGVVLHTHMKMKGAWRVFARGAARPAISDEVVVWLEVQDGTLAVCFRAPVARVLRSRELASDPQLERVGPDPVADDFDATEALKRMRQSTLELRDALLDQSVIAGIGNEWKSELLFQQKLDPFALVGAFTDEELAALLTRVRVGMSRSVQAAKGTRRSSRIYGKAGQLCSVCGTRVRVVAGGAWDRSTYFCPECQPSRTRRAAIG